MGGRQPGDDARAGRPGAPAERRGRGRPYPSLAGDDLEWVLFEPEAGVLRARRATEALARRARGNGADIVRGLARPDAAAVVLDSGERLEGDRVVWACGAWLGRSFPTSSRCA